MDIRDWPLGQIMQLPDECFGRRFNVCVGTESKSLDGAWDISEIAFPEVCVLWNVTIWDQVTGGVVRSLRLALGDQLPLSKVQMDALEPLIPGLGYTGPEPRIIPIIPGPQTISLPMRYPLTAQGRRLVMELTGAATVAAYAEVVVEVSSIPREVPDCLFSR